jgi:hypothetical protein
MRLSPSGITVLQIFRCNTSCSTMAAHPALVTFVKYVQFSVLATMICLKYGIYVREQRGWESSGRGSGIPTSKCGSRRRHDGIVKLRLGPCALSTRRHAGEAGICYGHLGSSFYILLPFLVQAYFGQLSTRMEYGQTSAHGNDRFMKRE